VRTQLAIVLQERRDVFNLIFRISRLSGAAANNLISHQVLVNLFDFKLQILE